MRVCFTFYAHGPVWTLPLGLPLPPSIVWCTQGLLSTLCASVILVNPVAKLAITMDPVGTAANASLAAAVPGL